MRRLHTYEFVILNLRYNIHIQPFVDYLKPVAFQFKWQFSEDKKLLELGNWIDHLYYNEKYQWNDYHISKSIGACSNDLFGS